MTHAWTSGPAHRGAITVIKMSFSIPDIKAEMAPTLSVTSRVEPDREDLGQLLGGNLATGDTVGEPLEEVGSRGSPSTDEAPVEADGGLLILAAGG